MNEPHSAFTWQQDMRAEALTLNREAFLARYPTPVLWVTPPPGTAGVSAQESSPVDPVESYRRTILQDDSLEADPAAAAAYLDRVAPLDKRPNNPFPNMISVGRAGNNDVVIALGSISKLQAYFMREGDNWSLTDWSSTNGTTISNKRIDPRKPQRLESGVQVSFGKEFWALFLLPEHLYRELRAETPTEGLKLETKL